MAGPRERRPKPEPMSAEEAAENEAKYQLLCEWIERMRVQLAEHRRSSGEPDGEFGDSLRIVGA